MQLPNEWASKITDKDQDIAQKAARHIINNMDMDAWSCLAENEDNFFDFIKDKVAQRLINAVSEENFTNLFVLMQRYNDWLADIVALAISKFEDLEINSRMLEYLIKGDADQKAYAARYFVYADYEPAVNPLINCLESSDETLKLNAAEALGAQNSQKAYSMLLEMLNNPDDWKKLEAAEFLAAFGNTEGVKPVLKAMLNSNMKENMASEAASLACLADYYYTDDQELKALALEAVDTIINGIPEILPLSNLLVYNFYECIESLLKLAEYESDNYLAGKYAQILLRARLKFDTLVNNEQYTFDEEKETLEEIKHINNILKLRDKTFWDDMTYLLVEELDSQDYNRKANAISTVTELGLAIAGEKLVEIIKNPTTPELILCEAVYAIESLKYYEALPELKKVLIRINDPNRSAIIHNTIQVLEKSQKAHA
jgi:HEAT repeat protein